LFLQKSLQKSLPLAGVLVFHRHRQVLFLPNESSKMIGPRKWDGDKIPKQYFEMLD
jgi:hypothetical protein